MNYRYEIKVPISQYNEIIFLNWFLSLRNIRVHNPPREINNIYFDNLNFTSAQNNIDGISERAKFRVRWYNSDFFSKNVVKTIQFSDKKDQFS